MNEEAKNSFAFELIARLVMVLIIAGIFIGSTLFALWRYTKIYEGRELSAYYAVKEEYYCNFKPAGEADSTWYIYNHTEDTWKQIGNDDLPYQLGVKDVRSDHWYCNVWEEGCPFPDFRESAHFN